MTRDPHGFIRGVGTQPALLEALLELEPGAPTMPEPVVAPQYLWLGRLLERQRPERERFEADLEQLRASYTEALAPRLFEARYPTWHDRYGVQMDLGPLREALGAPPKKGP